MLGSSSTSFARGILAATSTTSSSVRCLSSSSSRLSSRKVLVELLQDHPKLGNARDRVLVAPGYARHLLVPGRIARLVPFFKKYALGPSRYVGESVKDSKRLIEVTLPDGTRSRAGQSLDQDPSRTTPIELLNTLQSIPSTITFPLRTIDSDPQTLHGSLTLYDIQTRLVASYGIQEGQVNVNWGEGDEGGLVDNRIKHVGSRKVVVRVRGRGGEQREVNVEVVSLQHAAGEENAA